MAPGWKVLDSIPKVHSVPVGIGRAALHLLLLISDAYQMKHCRSLRMKASAQGQNRRMQSNKWINQKNDWLINRHNYRNWVVVVTKLRGPPLLDTLSSFGGGVAVRHLPTGALRCDWSVHAGGQPLPPSSVGPQSPPPPPPRQRRFDS